tara:strand:+ start:4944 stop:5981 length:1038 start_codon:yes stop_codon:yes gene_type:complete
MNVALIGKFYTEGTGQHLTEAIESNGDKVIQIDPEINFYNGRLISKRMRNVGITFYKEVLAKHPKVKHRASKKIYTELLGENIDLVISLHDFLDRKEVKNIKKITKSPVCIWFPDALVNLKKSMFFYADYDFLFFKDLYLIQQVKNELNLNAHYLPQCCNPDKHKIEEFQDGEEDFYACEITNAGNLYPSRAALLSQLKEQFQIKLWGDLPPIWLNAPELDSIVMRKVVYNKEKAKAFRAAKVVLNNLHPTEVNGLNKRTFEVAPCGGFQITNLKPCTSALFEIDKEIVCYSTFNELVEKLTYYIDDKNKIERQAIIEAGRKRVLKDHTYLNRYQQLLEVVFGTK